MDETAIDIRMALGVIRRQWRLVVLVTLLVVLLAGVVSVSMPRIYSATALVLVDPTRKNLLEPDINLASGMSDSARVDGEVELVRSDAMLLEVVERLELANAADFASSGGLLEMLFNDGTVQAADANMALAALRNAVTVQRRGMTYLIAVQARSRSGARASEIANALAGAYIDTQLRAKVEAVLAAESALQGKAEDARAGMVAADAAFDRYMDQNISEIDAQSGSGSIGVLRRQLAALEAARDLDLAEADRLARQIGGFAGELPQPLGAVVDDAQVALSEQVALENVGTGGELGQLQLALDAVQSSIVQSGDEIDHLRQRIRSAVLASPLSSEVLTEFYGLQQRVQLSRSQYQTLLARTQELGAQVSLQLPDSRVVSPALVPGSPSEPRTTMILLVGLLGGLATGLIVAFVYENYVGGFTSEHQAENILRLPVSSSIPVQRRGQSPADMMSNAPLSGFAEAIRRTRVGVEQALRSSEKRAGATVIMVTSAMPEEGKSTTALALARAYAQAGQRTLLVDGDLRQPSLHRLLGLQPEHGLLDALQPQGFKLSTDAILHRDPGSTAIVLVGARRSLDATDKVVANERFAQMITAAREQFDVVVVDTPPLQPVVDGLYVARLVDAVVFVVRWSATNQQDARSSLRALQSFASGPTVLVLNQHDAAASSKARRYGDYYVEPG